MTYCIEILDSELKLSKTEHIPGLKYFRRDGSKLVPREYHISLSSRFFEELLVLAGFCEGYIEVEWEDGDRTRYVLSDGQLEIHEAVIRYEKNHEIPAEPVSDFLRKGAVKLENGAVLVYLREHGSICCITGDKVCIASATSTHVWRLLADILRGMQTPEILCRSPFGTVSEREGQIRKKAVEAAEKVL